jgi:two-component system LytT family sensor kinase
MKVRWRQHEMIFVTMAAAMMLGGYVWRMRNTAWQQYAGPFINNHVPFNLFRNVLLPDIGVGLMLYCTYIFLNLVTIPRLASPKKFEAGTAQITVSLKKIITSRLAGKILKKALWLIAQFVLIVLLLGTAYNAAVYLSHEWQFHYPGFSIFFNKNNPNSQLNIWGGYAMIAFLLGAYLLYAFVRESVINAIEQSSARRAFRTFICNQVTVFLIQIFLVPFFLVSFNLVHGGRFVIAFFSLVIPLFLVFMSNTYWLFPLKGEGSFFARPVINRLLITTFLFTLPFPLAFPTDHISVFIIGWATQLLVITPVTWLVYQQKKDKILALVGAQKALVKSTADLQFLRSQINPHFLFNVLNTLYGTALQEKADRTATGIQQLGDMMRFMLHENNLDRIDMNREIDYLNNYIALQKLRTQSSPEIIIEDNISEQNCHHKIAPMLLIPFVENAFKHGISLTEKSWIKINLTCNEKEIIFSVRNSMHSRQQDDPEKEKSGIGFRNVLQRLKLIYPGKHTITANGDGEEFFVQLSIQP